LVVYLIHNFQKEQISILFQYRQDIILIFMVSCSVGAGAT